MSNLVYSLIVTGVIVGIFGFIVSIIVGSVWAADEKYKSAIFLILVGMPLSNLLLVYCYKCLSSGQL